MLHWLQEHQFPCLFHQLWGINCPFCGFQRSVIALLQGDWVGSLLLFPALFPLAVTLALLAVQAAIPRAGLRKALTGLLVADLVILAVNCTVRNILLFV